MKTTDCMEEVSDDEDFAIGPSPREVMGLRHYADLDAGDGICKLTVEQYDALDRQNISGLKPIGRSGLHYLHAKSKGRKDTASLLLGRLTHEAILEPKKYAANAVTYPGPVRRGKEWEAFRAANADKTIVTAAERATADALADAVRNHEIAHRATTGGEAEIGLLWTTEVATADGRVVTFRCKGRLDFVKRGKAIIDLKTANDASPAGFAKASYNYGYHMQIAWYADGYEAVTGEKLPVFFVVVEVEAPHVVAVYEVPEEILNRGREEYRELLLTLDECQQSGHWPGYFDGVIELELPRWAGGGKSDEDLDELGLDFGDAVSDADAA